MEIWKESQLTQLSYTKEMETAYQISLSFIKNLGFKFCAFSMSSKTCDTHINTVNKNNYPTDWNIQYEQKKCSAIDPILAHCNHSTLPIIWSEDLFYETPWLWQALQNEGLQYGWSQSIHDEDNGLRSIFSLARSHCPITPYELYENLGFVVFISRHLHALGAQTQSKALPRSSIPHLSARELEILKLSANGKTAYEAAKILNLSERTVNFHVHSAIQKLGVNNKIAAVIAAARAGVL
ncbi:MULTISPECIES: autoinducer binding domain-containing protein [unclassified Pseudomonas]|uniref:autoinducer binding domain-containing protein n=1 Tax=unclassified Pseudomonas TaxID=196821 RepID=UPI002AC9063A|nr:MULTISPECIES: autoinducer binding domain-containing protein [unclassified Pseudomonas]MEB0044575.1 autoinducer binding domain-containing protein [Pseudomonas sp. Dout3]MEB0095773.1 autoinducer binding domain-containing protein [Pseudomonas sp. DC1.2]WPX58180.1 autoinducer binding domain-containing protein [Pseudomonas sp. DC1.2]